LLLLVCLRPGLQTAGGGDGDLFFPKGARKGNGALGEVGGLRKRATYCTRETAPELALSRAREEAEAESWEMKNRTCCLGVEGGLAGVLCEVDANKLGFAAMVEVKGI
jgi:hypothetical protein